MITPRQREAMQWLLRIQDESATTEDFNAWQQWLAEDPENRRAFREIEDLWQDIGESRERPWPSLRELNEDRYEGDVSVEDHLQRSVRRESWRHPAFVVGLAASVALVTLGIFRVIDDSSRAGPAGNEVASFVTAPAEDLQIPLRDGSVMTVGAKSRVDVELTDAARRVVIDSGEAFFKVARDPSRPFVVRAGEGTITAIGTAFNVHHVSGRTAVTVTEGKVSVAPGSARNEVMLLVAGEQVTYGPGAAPIKVATDPAIATAWRSGRLTYRNESLEFVVADVSRYTQQPIMIADPMIGNLRYTGTVLPAEIDDWLMSLADTFPVAIKHAPDAAIRLERR